MHRLHAMKTIRSCRYAVLAGLLFSGLPCAAQFFDPPRANLAPVAERRAELMKKYDQDANGRLSAAERERMRKDWAASQLQGAGRNRGRFPVPPELLKEFDKDGNGEL